MRFTEKDEVLRQASKPVETQPKKPPDDELTDEQQAALYFSRKRRRLANS